MRALTKTLGVLLTFAASLSCSSSSQSVTAPTSSKCQLTIAAEPAAFAAGGGTGTLAVTTNRDCQWNAAASGDWIQLGDRSSGQGDATFAFSVAVNPAPSQRRGAITVGDEQVAISQEAAPCRFTVSPLDDSASPAGERRAIGVAASSAQCSWSARSETDWLTIVQGSQGNGNGEVVYEAGPTTGPSRRGELTIAGHRVTVTQGGGCSVAVAPTVQTVSADGGSGVFTVTTAAGCPWSAQSEAGWISITSAASGTGPASVTFSVAAWNGPSRSGELTIAGQRVTVTQVTGCGVALAPLAQTVSAGGGSGAFSVATAAGCPWSVQSQAAWIAITSATSGTGPATVTFSVGAWDGPARSGTVQVGEQLFTVRQNSGCRFSISPETYPAPSSGGSGAVGVATAALCEWTATSNAPWITVAAGGGNGRGTGTVQFNVAPTTGPARSGTLTIAGRTFTVSQASGCTFGISPTAGRIAHAGGPGSVAVSTSAGCVWAASSSVPWARITSGPGGTGAGAATFLVDHTTTSLPRSGTLQIAGHTFTIDQDGAPCLYVLGPPSAELEAGGGAGVFEVNTAENCPWTAASNDAWVHVTAGRSGSGDGTVGFTVDPNPGPARTGSIAAGGRLFTVTQRAAAP